MKAKRKRYDSEFKARVALEALKGERTIQEIAKEYEVHPVQVSELKKRMRREPLRCSKVAARKRW